MVFTVNYFALITTVCAKLRIPYVVWTCDNPLISMYNRKVFEYRRLVENAPELGKGNPNFPDLRYSINGQPRDIWIF